MGEEKEEKVSGLLQQGLELYGTGDVARAFLLWTEALELDPGNEEALDYIRDADRRAKPRGESKNFGVHSFVDDARRLMREADVESALELLMSAPTPVNLETEAMVELLRSSLFRQYREELGDLSRRLRLVSDSASDLRSRNLPTSAGFLLSMIDGMTPLEDLVSLSGMDRFEALRSVHRMLQEGIVEWAQ